MNKSQNKTLKKTTSGKTTYSVKEVGEMLGISRQGVYRLIHENCFKAVRTERKFRIIKASFDTWLDGKEQEDKDGIHS